MEKIVIKDNFGFLYLSKDFYSKSLIANTISIYSEFMKSSLSEIGKYNVIKFELISNDYDLNTLINEFLNYLLSLEFENKSNGVENNG